MPHAWHIFIFTNKPPAKKRSNAVNENENPVVSRNALGPRSRRNSSKLLFGSSLICRG